MPPIQSRHVNAVVVFGLAPVISFVPGRTHERHRIPRYDVRPPDTASFMCRWLLWELNVIVGAGCVDQAEVRGGGERYFLRSAESFGMFY